MENFLQNNVEKIEQRGESENLKYRDKDGNYSNREQNERETNIRQRRQGFRDRTGESMIERQGEYGKDYMQYNDKEVVRVKE